MNAARILREAGIDAHEVGDSIAGVDPEQIWVYPAGPLLRKIWGPALHGMSVGGFVVMDPAVLDGEPGVRGRLTLHELVHVRQWRELGFAGFALRYLNGYLGNRRRGLNRWNSYLEIPLELEAREVAARHG